MNKWNQATISTALIVCTAAPLIFLHYRWANTLLQSYVATAFLFGVLLVGEYPPLRSTWFLRATVPVLVLHALVVVGLVLVNYEIPGVNGLPRVVFGFLGIIVVLEWKISLWLIDYLRPKQDL